MALIFYKMAVLQVNADLFHSVDGAKINRHVNTAYKIKISCGDIFKIENT